MKTRKILWIAFIAFCIAATMGVPVLCKAQQYAYQVPGWTNTINGTPQFNNRILMDSVGTWLPVENPGSHTDVDYKKRNKTLDIKSKQFWDKYTTASGRKDSILTIKTYYKDTIFCKEIIIWDETSDKVFPIRRIEVNFLRKQEYPSQYYNDRTETVYFMNGQTAVNVLWIKEMDNRWTKVKNIFQ